MQGKGSIAKELYSEIMQPSVVEFGRDSAAIQANENLQENDQDDLWCDDETYKDPICKMSEKSEMEREWEKRRDQFHTIGYRDGLIAGKEGAAQEGFNIGFKASVFPGHNWGFVRGITSAMSCLPSGTKEKLIKTEETRSKFQSLHESVQAVSTTDALKLFYQGLKRKSENQTESAQPISATTDSSSQNALESYERQLQSLLSESPLLEGSQRIN